MKLDDLHALPAFVFLAVILFQPPALCQADQVDFAADVAPILEEHCIECHYPGLEKGGLSLHSAKALFENSVVVPGKPSESYLLDLVTAGDDGEEPRMPKDGRALTADEVAILRDWIDQGAKWPEAYVVRTKSKADSSWWSLKPLSTPEIPSLDPTVDPVWENWRGNAIDRFVGHALQAKGWVPNGPADRRTLMRRLSYDLHGVPPTPLELQRFADDSSEDAYEQLVDRLLASPKYGERWGRHWLDVVRFGESTGYERNVIIEDAWPFRDYVIDSLNSDKPINRLIQEHIAGDVMDPESPEVVIGTAFLVNGPYDNVGNQDAVQAAQIRANTIDEMIRTTTEAFLGMTVGCARCHDHKFDPILQKDYYRLYATYAGVKHGSSRWASPDQLDQFRDRTTPLKNRQAELRSQQDRLKAIIDQRVTQLVKEGNPLEEKWTRPSTNRLRTEDRFSPTEAKFVKLTCLSRDDDPAARRGFNIDEFEIWTAEAAPQNVALASAGAKASGPSRSIEDFPGAYGPQLAIDGKTGARFIAASDFLQIELASSEMIDRVVFSSARGAANADQSKFRFVADYRVEVSTDGKVWTTVSSGDDRQPVHETHLKHRLRRHATSPEEAKSLAKLNSVLAGIKREINEIPEPPRAWIGTRDGKAAQGPFHVFLGGNPQRLGGQVFAASLSMLPQHSNKYQLDETSSESERRLALARWITADDNALASRVLANRVWHYHFGTGLVSTPSDFGYMGGKPSHPELLDYLAGRLVASGWQLKPLHRMIVLSATYRQSSEYREAPATLDADSRLLWRFPSRRLSAEEIRDSMLIVSGQLEDSMGGPGFRLYRYLQDNVATYVPKDQHGPETFRRSIYHQNARACTTDLFTDFDQPDCAFSTGRRVETTSPLQALTSLNHSFTVDMAEGFADRLQAEVGDSASDQCLRAFQLCFSRKPSPSELEDVENLIREHSLVAFCRALFNASEFIYLR